MHRRDGYQGSYMVYDMKVDVKSEEFKAKIQAHTLYSK